MCLLFADWDSPNFFTAWLHHRCGASQMEGGGRTGGMLKGGGGFYFILNNLNIILISSNVGLLRGVVFLWLVARLRITNKFYIFKKKKKNHTINSYTCMYMHTYVLYNTIHTLPCGRQINPHTGRPPGPSWKSAEFYNNMIHIPLYICYVSILYSLSQNFCIITAPWVTLPPTFLDSAEYQRQS